MEGKVGLWAFCLGLLFRESGMLRKDILEEKVVRENKKKRVSLDPM